MRTNKNINKIIQQITGIKEAYEELTETIVQLWSDDYLDEDSRMAVLNFYMEMSLYEDFKELSDILENARPVYKDDLVHLLVHCMDNMDELKECGTKDAEDIAEITRAMFKMEENDINTTTEFIIDVFKSVTGIELQFISALEIAMSLRKFLKEEVK